MRVLFLGRERKKKVATRKALASRCCCSLSLSLGIGRTGTWNALILSFACSK